MITKEELIKAQNIIKQHEIEQLHLSRISKRSCCSKCGKSLRWQKKDHYIKLEIGIDCCSTEALFGKGEKIGFNHPAIKKGSGHQKLFIESKTESDYRLCRDCHKSFVKQVGNFLRYPTFLQKE